MNKNCKCKCEDEYVKAPMEIVFLQRQIDTYYGTKRTESQITKCLSKQ